MSGKPNRMKLRFDNPLTVPQVSLGVSGTSSGSSSSGSSTSVEPPTPGNLDKKTTITFGGEVLEISPENIEVVSQLGRGAYGIVERVKHTPSGHEMAVKRITANMSQEQRKQLMDMDVLDKGAGCENIVKFYGALFWEGDLWIFMQVMDTSLDKFYKMIYPKKGDMNGGQGDEDHDELPEGKFIPEPVLGKIAASIINALHYLHTIKIIHRDIKPSNILINRSGEVKLCDFGIAGYLVDSIAKTFEAGCKPYMAPERINPTKDRKGYDIRSDVWSLGITMVELSIGKFPYPETPGNFFQQLKRVCDDEPPRLPKNSRFSTDFQDFIEKCLQKDYKLRPYYSVLLIHPFIEQNKSNTISDFVSRVLDKTPSESKSSSSSAAAAAKS